MKCIVIEYLLEQAIVNNFTRKSTGVRTDIRIARDTMLRDAANDLRRMREAKFVVFLTTQ